MDETELKGADGNYNISAVTRTIANNPKAYRASKNISSPIMRKTIDKELERKLKNDPRKEDILNFVNNWIAYYLTQDDKNITKDDLRDIENKTRAKYGVSIDISGRLGTDRGFAKQLNKSNRPIIKANTTGATVAPNAVANKQAVSNTSEEAAASTNANVSTGTIFAEQKTGDIPEIPKGMLNDIFENAAYFKHKFKNDQQKHAWLSNYKLCIGNVDVAKGIKHIAYYAVMNNNVGNFVPATSGSMPKVEALRSQLSNTISQFNLQGGIKPDLMIADMIMLYRLAFEKMGVKNNATAGKASQGLESASQTAGYNQSK